ncbi:hypothetical protein [Paenibacillus forsythiae]|uniref:hypothetical protein n=1 Tax=Paenibacillus forsythiae TaxID=365616 RepID=UPI0012EC5B7E|nr:hypothetical protein [Paenibacillus forsythiae]
MVRCTGLGGWGARVGVGAALPPGIPVRGRREGPLAARRVASGYAPLAEGPSQGLPWRVRGSGAT